ncbi:MAG: S1 RNA-binding domain-containing protein [bacterium]|nr:S1 RNA-binding domain-containing protein [bacterium]MDZ4284957.1 S1 RNA-binding domain-containing protein [Patescibacteria group bacterium]
MDQKPTGGTEPQRDTRADFTLLPHDESTEAGEQGYRPHVLEAPDASLGGTDESSTEEATERVRPERSAKRLPKKHESPMAALILRAGTPPVGGDLVHGNVVAIGRMAVYVDLSPFGTGTIYGREYQSARDLLRKVNIGDEIAAKVVASENEDGYIELSLKEARQALVWSEAERLARARTTIELVVKDANKGGLILEWQGVSGFLPASQLTAEHYPHVAGGDKDQILEALRALVGEHILVSVLSVLPKEGKLIFTEKYGVHREKQALVDKYNVGDELDGEVTGTVDFGAFVKLEDSLEGLVHLSEIDWGLVDNPRAFVSTGDRVRVKIIDIKDDKISLSMKALKPNPWKEAGTRYHRGERVQGVIIKYNRHGALASIEEGIAGLVHISEFGGSESELHATLELGKSYPFLITHFDPSEQRMALSYTQALIETASKESA